MEKAEELKKITRQVLGELPGAGFYAKVDKMLEDGEWSTASLLSATREIEKIVRLFVGVEDANSLGKKYKDYFHAHTFHI